MSFSSKILPAVALAVALSPLSPLAAQARSNPPEYYRAALHHDPVMASSTTIDNPTTIYSGMTAQKFRSSIGG